MRETRERVFQAPEHGIERDGERLKLARPAGGFDSLTQMARLNAFKRAPHFGQWAKPTTCYCDSDQSGGDYSQSEHKRQQCAELLFKSPIAGAILSYLKRKWLSIRYRTSRGQREYVASFLVFNWRCYLTRG